MRIAAQHKPVKPVKPEVDSVTITLSGDEAKKLRRVCYYNKTVSARFVNNPNGGRRKGEDILAFMTSLGNSLKKQGVERF